MLGEEDVLDVFLEGLTEVHAPLLGNGGEGGETSPEVFAVVGGVASVVDGRGLRDGELDIGPLGVVREKAFADAVGDTPLPVGDAVVVVDHALDLTDEAVSLAKDHADEGRAGLGAVAHDFVRETAAGDHAGEDGVEHLHRLAREIRADGLEVFAGFKDEEFTAHLRTDGAKVV